MKTLLVILIFIATTESIVNSEEVDPIDVQLRTELQQLQESFNRSVQLKKTEAIRKYEARLVEAERAKRTDLVNELRAKIAALRNEPPPKPVAPPPPSASEQRVLGSWILENAHGGAMGDMRIEKISDSNFRLKRVGGGALAVDGDYTLEGDRLVKVKRVGDAYSDLTWRISGTKLRLTEGQYKDWVLRRSK